MRPVTAGVVIVSLVLSIASSTGLLQAANAFVNIVSPSKGEAVPAGSSLTVSGTSDNNTQFSCNIQILVNDHRP
jgi:hypothetical protein